MSLDYRFDPLTDYEDIDTSMCENCRYSDNTCWNAGRCLMEDYE